MTVPNHYFNQYHGLLYQDLSKKTRPIAVNEAHLFPQNEYTSGVKPPAGKAKPYCPFHDIIVQGNI
jgi:hypothetical protein